VAFLDGVGVFFQEQVLVKTHFCIHRVIGRDPVDGGLHFASIGRVATAGFGIASAVNFGDGACSVLDDVGTLDEVSAAKAHFGAWREAKELLGRIFAEVVLLDVKLAREDDVAGAGRWILGIVDDLEVLDLTLRIVVDDDFQRAKHSHDSRRAAVEVFADEVLEHAELDYAVGLRGSDGGTEIT